MQKLDPGNLGGILRTAYYLGVDAVVLSTHGAPLGPVTLKASVGAAEYLPLLSVHDTSNFVRSSKENDWKFYAAVAPRTIRGSQHGSKQPHLWTTSIGQPMEHHPCILMLGGEGIGLRSDLQKKADYLVSVDGHRSGSRGVDSLNVSVAAGILCESFLRRVDLNGLYGRGDTASATNREDKIW